MPDTINPAIFRAYDIRGIVDQDLTTDVLFTLGQTVGTYFRQQYAAQRMVVGRDVRPSSPALQQAFVRGVQAAGLHIIDIGEVATPVMYFAVEHLGVDAGAVISASHNPPQYNGVKLRVRDDQHGSAPLASSEIAALGALAQQGMFATGRGTYASHDIRSAYLDSFQRRVTLPRNYGLKIVLDGGNGVAGPLARRAFELLGVEVVPLYIEPDGTFPNHHPDPVKPENLRDLAAAVRESRADLGIALDGDGDRLGVVDATGTVVPADRVMIVLARHLLREKPQQSVVFDVKCSMVLINAIKQFNGQPVMGKTGYPNMSAKMREVGAVLGGELSGHIIVPVPGHYFDDGAFAGAHLLAALYGLARDEGGWRSLHDVLAPHPVLPVANEGRIACPDDRKFAVIAQMHERFRAYKPITVDGVRVALPDGWGVVRASNTEPAITTRFEATTPERLEEIRAMLLGALDEFLATPEATTTP